MALAWTPHAMLEVPSATEQINMGPERLLEYWERREAAIDRERQCSKTFYLYQSTGWQVAGEDDCGEAQYNDWIAQFWAKGIPIPQIPRVEPDLAAAARAVAFVRMVKSKMV